MESIPTGIAEAAEDQPEAWKLITPSRVCSSVTDVRRINYESFISSNKAGYYM